MRKKDCKEFDDNDWGNKLMSDSSFRLFSKRYIDSYINDLPECEYKAYARLSGAILKTALLDAEYEVKKNPDFFGPRQQVIFRKPEGMIVVRGLADDGSDNYLNYKYDMKFREVPNYDVIAQCCLGIGLDVEFFRSKVSDYLDVIADQARQEQASSGNVSCIAKARSRKRARVRKQTQEIQIVSKPVLSRRRVIGDQYGWTF